ncbi:unnamed protein product [Soboliphyme baturini]|uniref:YceI domain-containing protein n=1 Tax=Soboliphyme baturini TaxID=241478 RepID=A0A183I9I8_9BILA|nr:unnamed protein product [Soboliphyme baturini]
MDLKNDGDFTMEGRRGNVGQLTDGALSWRPRRKVRLIAVKGERVLEKWQSVGGQKILRIDQATHLPAALDMGKVMGDGLLAELAVQLFGRLLSPAVTRTTDHIGGERGKEHQNVPYSIAFSDLEWSSRTGHREVEVSGSVDIKGMKRIKLYNRVSPVRRGVLHIIRLAQLRTGARRRWQPAQGRFGDSRPSIAPFQCPTYRPAGLPLPLPFASLFGVWTSVLLVVARYVSSSNRSPSGARPHAGFVLCVSFCTLGHLRYTPLRQKHPTAPQI